ncbi:MAG: hypothetical protein Q9167_003786 [Letrouitia subvulpina]
MDQGVPWSFDAVPRLHLQISQPTANLLKQLLPQTEKQIWLDSRAESDHAKAEVAMGDAKAEDTQDREGKAENSAIPQAVLQHESPPESDPISQQNTQYTATSNRIATENETAERWIAGEVAEVNGSIHSPQTAAIRKLEEMKESARSTAIPEAFQAPALSPVNQLMALSTQAGDPLTMTQETLGSTIDDPTLDSAHSIVESEPQRIQGFAKLEFTDGEFYMNTYSVELGRDIRAARLAMERDLAHVQRTGAKRRKRSSSDGDLSEHAKWPNGRPISSSVVSESGGVIALDHSDIETTKRKRRRRTKSTTSSSQQLSRKSSFVLPLIRTDYQSLAMASLMDSSLGHQYHDPHSSLPRPEACPLIPVHPPAAAEGARSGHKTISRKHIKIAFNFEKHCFEVKIMGRNGAFVDEHWYPEGDIRPLRSGSVIQIGGVLIRFVLPDLAIDGAVQDASGSVSESSVSLDVADGQDQNRSMEDSSGTNNEEEGEEDENGYEDGDEEDEEDSNDNEKGCDEIIKAAADEEPAEGPAKTSRPARRRKTIREKEPSKAIQHPKTRKTKSKQVQPPVKEDIQGEPLPPPPKRKGPGRPPKDGHMSQKERKRLRQQAAEAAKALEQGDTIARSGGGKGKSIQPNGVNQGDSSRQPNGKRKYKKRRTKAEIEAEEREAARESAEHGGSDPPKQNDARSTKPPKPLKPAKPPRSPSPEIDEASLTAEQKAKPQASYVVLIHDVLTNSKTGQLSLPQIYRAIERKYPYFKFDKAATTTKGWQSSVRHNLSQHAAFRKIEREGKGWMWGLVPGVSIDKERKRRGTPPSMPQQPDQPPAPHTMQHSFHPQIPPPSANMHYPSFGGYVNVHPSQRPYQPPPQSQFAPVSNSFLMQFSGLQPDSTYQSPYGSAPPKTSDPPNLSENPQPHPSAPNMNKETPKNKASTTADSPQENCVDPPNNPSMSQLSHPQQHPTPNVNGTAETHKPSHSQDLLRAVQRFKNALISSMPDDAHAEARVTSVISRTLGTTLEAGAPRGSPEDEEEKAIRKALENMIEKFERKNGGKASDLLPPPSSQEKQQGREEESPKAKPGLSREEESGGGEPTQLMKILEEVSRGEDGMVELPPTSLGSTMGADLVNGDVHRSRDSDAAAAAMTETKTGGRDGQSEGSGTKRRREEVEDESADAAEETAAKRVAT